jgi:phage shock protein A
MLVHEQIVELLSLPETGAGAPTRARVEDTLTEGYAQALVLEAERLRLERRLGEVARAANGDDASGAVEQIAALSERLTRADGELARLRSQLARLRDRARALRR